MFLTASILHFFVREAASNEDQFKHSLYFFGDVAVAGECRVNPGLLATRSLLGRPSNLLGCVASSDHMRFIFVKLVLITVHI